MKFSDCNYPVIYKITNTVTNKIYIGKSIKFFNRYKYYKYNHKGKRMHIYRSMCKYGFDKFLFEIIERCEISELIERELFWILYYKSTDLSIGYNLRMDSKENSGFKHSDITKDKISKKLKGRKPWHSGLTGLKCFRSKATLEKFSKEMTGGGNPNAKKVYQYDKYLNFIKEYDSASTASRDLDIVFQGICRAASGERKSYKNFIWAYSPLH